jgi:hypothetical protein
MNYTAAIRAVLQLKGQAPFQLSGLEIYETLARIDASVTRCLQDHTCPLLEKIQTLTRRRHKWDEIYRDIHRRQELVLGLASILDVPLTSKGWYTQAGVEVAQEVEQFLDGLSALKTVCPDDASFIEHIIRRTQDWAPGLFFCYEIPAIPRTNNDLEQYNGTLKRHQRRVTGRKETADYITRHGPYVVFFDSHLLIKSWPAFVRFLPMSFAKSGSALLLPRFVNNEFVVSGVTPMAFSIGLSLSGATALLDAIMLILLRLISIGVPW